MNLEDPNLLPPEKKRHGHELEHINWKLVVAIAFGFFVWYVGAALVGEHLSPDQKDCCPAYPDHFAP